MEASLPTSDQHELALPDGVDPADLYEGPKVIPHPSSPKPPMPKDLIAPIPIAPAIARAEASQVSHDLGMKNDYPAVVMLALDVLAARLHALVALTTACLIWGFVVWDPNEWRILAAGVFSLSVFLPMAFIYWKAGMTGEGG